MEEEARGGGGYGPHYPNQIACGLDLPPTEGRVGHAAPLVEIRGDQRKRIGRTTPGEGKIEGRGVGVRAIKGGSEKVVTLGFFLFLSEELYIYIC
jgi:hypothetical protein